MQRAKKQKELKNLFRRDCGIERLPNKPQDSDVVLREQEAAPARVWFITADIIGNRRWRPTAQPLD